MHWQWCIMLRCLADKVWKTLDACHKIRPFSAICHSLEMLMLHLTASAKEILKIPTLLCLLTWWGLSPNHTKKIVYADMSRSNHNMSTPLFLLQGDEPCHTQCWSREQQCSSEHKPTSQASSEQLTQGIIQPALADPILNSHHLCPKVMWITPVSYGLTPQTRTWMSWLPYRRKFSIESNSVTCNWCFTLRDVLLAMLNNQNRNCLA